MGTCRIHPCRAVSFFGFSEEEKEKEKEVLDKAVSELRESIKKSKEEIENSLPDIEKVFENMGIKDERSEEEKEEEKKRVRREMIWNAKKEAEIFLKIVEKGLTK